MHYNNDNNGEVNQHSEHNNIHNVKNVKNCSTSSTDSGVILIDNTATFNGTPQTEATFKDKNNYTHNATGTKGDSGGGGGGGYTGTPHISIEQTVNINTSPTNLRTKKRVSPTLSVRSTSISIVSIDENAADSSCIDSDSDVEADAEGVHNGYTVKKLGQQVSYPPNSTEIPQLNKGLKVISQQVQQSNDRPITPNAGIVAEQVLNGNLGGTSSPASGPQIGTIALNNSTDVTFGDKHFYEGPVTIQQFLIDNRDKWKPVDGDGIDNPGFYNGTAAGCKDGEREGDVSTNMGHCFCLPKAIRRRIIVIAAIFVLFSIVLITILSQTTQIFSKPVIKSKLVDGEDSRQNIPINSTIDDDLDIIKNGSLVLVSRREWQGLPPKKPLDNQTLPLHNVIILHSATEDCNSKTVCSYRARFIQQFHQGGHGWDDVGYNFMIGGDGRVYVGRGWDLVGANVKGYNYDYVGIAFIGIFNWIKPTPEQLLACQLLMAEGVRLGKLTKDYRLFGHRQLSGTESPGLQLYNIIQKWPHWASKV